MQRSWLQERFTPTLWIGAAGLLAAAATGALAALQPLTALLIVAALGAGGAIWFLWQRGHSPALLFTMTLLGGYVCFGRWFAGFHLQLGGLPLYIGEIGLALLLPLVLRVRLRSLGPAALWLVAWMGFNAVLTLRQLPQYGLDAVRDAAVWYYGLYAAIGAVIWRRHGTASLRRAFTVVFLALLLAVPFVYAQDTGRLPPLDLPFADQPLAGMRWDAASMYLLGGAVFFLAGQSRGRVGGPRWLGLGMGIAALALVIALLVRAALIGLLGVLALMAIYRMWRPLAIVVLAPLGVIVLLGLLDVEVETGRGPLSAGRVIEYQLSTFDFLLDPRSGSPADDTGTIIWRLLWWQALLDDARNDPELLLVGRGYGPDLRQPVLHLAIPGLSWDAGEDTGRIIRSPHNIVVTIFARSGVIGLGLWLAVLATSFTGIIRAALACRRRGDRANELFGIWLAAQLASILLIASFGVVLESPFGAIPFFWLLGVGIAWSQAQRQLATDPGASAEGVAPTRLSLRRAAESPRAWLPARR